MGTSNTPGPEKKVPPIGIRLVKSAEEQSNQEMDEAETILSRFASGSGTEASRFRRISREKSFSRRPDPDYDPNESAE